MTIDQIQSLPLFEIEETFNSIKEFFFSMYYDDKSYHTRLHLENDAIKCQNEDQVPLEFAMQGNVCTTNLLLGFASCIRW